MNMFFFGSKGKEEEKERENRKWKNISGLNNLKRNPMYFNSFKKCRVRQKLKQKEIQKIEQRNEHVLFWFPKEQEKKKKTKKKKEKIENRKKYFLFLIFFPSQKSNG